MFKEIINMQIKIIGPVGSIVVFLLPALLIIGPYFGIMKLVFIQDVINYTEFS
jgi:hypothetical protein